MGFNFPRNKFSKDHVDLDSVNKGDVSRETHIAQVGIYRYNYLAINLLCNRYESDSQPGLYVKPKQERINRCHFSTVAIIGEWSYSTRKRGKG
jgi:hypothetical protein